ncbi:MAG: formate dehydrogenase accessory protein FdhE [Terriglobales bacterium]|jgi:FdhE protein
MKQSKWNQRIRRAEKLAATYPFAAEVMCFYRQLAGFQETLYDSAKKEELGFLDTPLVLPRFGDFLNNLRTIAPAPLAQAAGKLLSDAPDRRQEVLASVRQATSVFQPTSSNPEHLMAWMFLQPFAEHLADSGKTEPRDAVPQFCPTCSAGPVAGVLRPEGDGGKRSLICALCATEWAIGRIVCPGCGETAVEKLSVYTADEFPHVRVEACNSCGKYIKTVDLTKNGLAVPIVDELATIPLNLWAQEHGYVKLQANLLGI